MVEVTKSIKIYQYFRYLKFASSASQNAGKCVSKSLEIQNFLGGACPQTPLESKALRVLQLLLQKLLKTLVIVLLKMNRIQPAIMINHSDFEKFIKAWKCTTGTFYQ